MRSASEVSRTGWQSVFGMRNRAINTSSDIAIARSDAKRGLLSGGQGV